METHHKGDFTEAVVIAELKRRNISTALPFGDNERYDLVVETPDGSLVKLQIKTGWAADGVINFHGRSSHTNSRGNVYKPYSGDVDYFAVYSHEYEELFLVPEDEVNSSKKLRVEEPDQPDPKINHAEEYTFDEQWPPTKVEDETERSITVRRGDGSCYVETVLEKFAEFGIETYTPWNDIASCDFLAGLPSGSFVRLRVRTGSTSDGRLTLNRSTEVETPRPRTETEYYVLCRSETDEMYLIASEEFETSIHLRVDEPEQIRRDTKIADEYRFESRWPPDGVPQISPKSSVAAVLEAFQRIDPSAGHVADESTPFDVLAETNDGTSARIAVVTGWTSRGCIRLKPDSCDGIDYFAIYHRETDSCYLVGADEFDRSISLRVEEPEKEDGTINWAEDYEFEDNWPP